ncbi:response regulator transcription factor [Vibrio hepatarius]|uniref:response regulator transcription factor n=1 Tax=Vibrio hepatarius TaxID=171383 RepID=UPI00142E5BBB|nr:response regulator transcription factor [Vibrio hepatarius]NIY82543.1 response regulator transcription factor [Vibrio hepatarius]NVJ57264.1 response regulator transcription factor [Vibrionaceae bacterium]
MKKILIIEDDKNVASVLCDFFESLQVEFDYASNGKLGFQLATEGCFDAIVLDLMLPRMNGLELCKALRSQGVDTPVLMLTAMDSREDLLKGYELGADDYLTKPFDLEVLEARLRALIRRYKGLVASSTLSFGELCINRKEKEAFREGVLLKLNPTSYSILELLCRKAPQVVSKQEIASLLWEEEEINTEALRVHIYHLRNQLDKPFSTQMLKTVPKQGFKLEV